MDPIKEQARAMTLEKGLHPAVSRSEQWAIHAKCEYVPPEPNVPLCGDLYLELMYQLLVSPAWINGECLDQIYDACVVVIMAQPPNTGVAFWKRFRRLIFTPKPNMRLGTQVYLALKHHTMMQRISDRLQIVLPPELKTLLVLLPGENFNWLDARYTEAPEPFIWDEDSSNCGPSLNPITDPAQASPAIPPELFAKRMGFLRAALKLVDDRLDQMARAAGDYMARDGWIRAATMKPEP